MSDPETPLDGVVAPSGASGVTPELQSAVEQVLAMFPGSRGDHDPTGQIDALGQLMDPEVRHRLMEAVEQMRSAGLEAAEHQGGGPAILDLRGTPAGEALRASVLQFASSPGAIQGLAPAQIIVDDAVPGAVPDPMPAVEPPPAQAPAPTVAPVMEAANRRQATVPQQPSLVEDAGAGGLLGWLGRLLNGREA